jgi:hypothetical protein
MTPFADSLVQLARRVLQRSAGLLSVTSRDCRPHVADDGAQLALDRLVALGALGVGQLRLI